MAFALNPGQALDGIIDYTTTEGRKLYNSATARLDEELFDCNADGLYISFYSRLAIGHPNTDGTMRTKESSASQRTLWTLIQSNIQS
jgi:hypothetical protein